MTIRVCVTVNLDLRRPEMLENLKLRAKGDPLYPQLLG